MRILLVAMVLMVTVSEANAGKRATGTGSKSSSSRVRGYTRGNGKYVAPHRRSTADHNPRNNWSAKGNVNPYKGKKK